MSERKAVLIYLEGQDEPIYFPEETIEVTGSDDRGVAVSITPRCGPV